ncbi:MAG: branched-chain amino acid ABC transporter permease, partial [Caldilineaceae bacterium]|nr:branched-chain amino acid ABC transporter permease [Caldilineaceae bacterium]
MSALSRNQILALVAVALAAALAFLYWNALAGWWDVNGTVLRQALVTGVLIGSVYGLVAMGLTLIFGVLDIINFAQGSMLAIGMYLALVLYEAFGVDPYLSILVTAPVLFLLGMAVERLMIHPARNAPAHNQLLLTLGLALFIENFLLVTFTATPRAIRLPYEREAFDLGVLLLDFP